jgi:2'-5' RNA ligase
MTRRATARLFVAVDVPRAVREELAAWARDVASALGFKEPRAASAPLRVLEPEAQHLTLCFLGSRPVEEIDTIGAAIGGCAGYVGEVSVGAPLWLPPRRPRTLAVEVHDREGGLAGLHEAVSSETSRAIDWEPERRRFRAHITVARMREARRRQAVAEGVRLPATPPLRFTPESLVLYRSWLSRAGATYEPLVARVLAPS